MEETTIHPTPIALGIVIVIHGVLLFFLRKNCYVFFSILFLSILFFKIEIVENLSL